MPLYEYQCDSCGHRFEVIRKFSDPPVETCPKCGSAVRKLVSSPAFTFKGSGWYITDYAKKDSGGGGEKKSGDAASESSTDSAKPSEAKTTEAKPATDAKPASSTDSGSKPSTPTPSSGKTD